VTVKKKPMRRSKLGRNSEAAAAYERAAAMAATDAERDFLTLGGRASRRAHR
jgi:RNA polymerase sigma-70 factor, ECF subfamily